MAGWLILKDPWRLIPSSLVAADLPLETSQTLPPLSRRMSFLHQASLRLKLVLVIMLSVGLALLLALLAFLVVEIRGYHASTQQELQLLAEVLEDGCVAALQVQEPAEAERLMNALQVQPRIVEAAVLDRDGHPFASYHRDGRPGIAPTNRRGIPAEGYHRETMTWTRTLLRADAPVGTLYLRADLRVLEARVAWLLAGAVLLILVIGATTLLFAKRMSRLITDPILHLAEAARRIATNRAVGECVLRETQDEVGVLVDAFNAMLRQLGERQTRLEESQRLAHLGDWTYDPENRHFEWSEETFRIFGVPYASAAPDYRTFRRLIQREDFKLLEGTLFGLRAGKEGVAADFRLTRRDGTVRWAHITSAWYKDASDRIVLRGTVMDISERKLSEAAMLQGQKLESLGVLAGGIAHDFNNLLGALRGNLDLARSELPKDAPSSAFIARSDKIIEKAANLTRQLLAYSGKGQFQVQTLGPQPAGAGDGAPALGLRLQEGRTPLRDRGRAPGRHRRHLPDPAGDHEPGHQCQRSLEGPGWATC